MKQFSEFIDAENYIKVKRKLYNEVIIIADGIKALNALNYIRDKPRYKKIIVYCDNYD